MDRQQRTLDAVIALNQFQNQELSRHKFLENVCEYFDFIKSHELDDSDYRFLIHLSSKAGVPHYYDILHKFNEDKILLKNEENVKLDVISALIFESTLYTNENSKLHLYQKEVLDFFTTGKINRYFLSASTSFGKTHLVYEIINKMNYKNVILIFPSIALLSENLSRIKEGKIKLSNNFKIHTLSDSEINPGENNILIFTPERYLSYLDKNKELKVDFIFVDEVYKIDNSYIIDDESKENERDIAYRMSLFYGLTINTNVDLFIAGPYIDVFEKTDEKYNPSFDLFLEDFKIEKVLLNEYEIVKVNKYSADIKIQTNFDSLDVNLKGKGTKKAKIQELFDRILLQNENAIIYCNTKSIAESVAREYERTEISTETFSDFLNHLITTFDERWIVIKALKKGIGVHHGVVPKYIQKEIIDLFNQAENNLNILSATTTITEGVNTTAKNMIVYKSSKGGGQHIKPLLKFDAKNIAGRAGRFMEHYVGRVITLDNDFLEVIEKDGKPIEHKNYDIQTPKNEVEFEMTKTEYLDDRTKEQIEELRKLQEQFGIPDYIINQFKVISKRQKIDIYEDISRLSTAQLSLIKKLISSLNSTTMSLDKDGFQIILDIILPRVENEKLKALIQNRFKFKPDDVNDYSILFASLSSYISAGFQGNYNYLLSRKLIVKKITPKEFSSNSKEKEISECIDSAMRETAELIYNTFKYQLVKYLGVFNLMYKYYISNIENKSLEETSGKDDSIVNLDVFRSCVIKYNNAISNTEWLKTEEIYKFNFINWIQKNIDFQNDSGEEIKSKIEISQRQAYSPNSTVKGVNFIQTIVRYQEDFVTIEDLHKIKQIVTGLVSLNKENLTLSFSSFPKTSAFLSFYKPERFIAYDNESLPSHRYLTSIHDAPKRDFKAFEFYQEFYMMVKELLKESTIDVQKILEILNIEELTELHWNFIA